MMKRIFIFICAAICIHSLYADSCRNIANQINHDIAKYSGRYEMDFPWMNLNWLKQHLGTVDSKQATEKNILYKWNCGAEDSFIIAKIDSHGSLVGVEGQYNSAEGTGLFSTSFPPVKTVAPATPQKMITKPEPVVASTPLPTPETNTPASAADRFHQYNEHFHVALNTQGEIQTDMIQRMKQYYLNLRTCKPGKYQFALPVLQDFLFHTAIISTPEDNHCRVKISYEIAQIGKIDLKCNFDGKDLALFTDKEAEIAARGQVKFDHNQPSILQTIMEKNCKRYVDGVA